MPVFFCFRSDFINNVWLSFMNYVNRFGFMTYVSYTCLWSLYVAVRVGMSFFLSSLQVGE